MNVFTFLAIAALLVIIELIYFAIAKRYNIIDRPNGRSSHKGVVVRGAGVLFPVSVLLYCLIGGIQSPWFVAALVMISGISFADDVRPMSAKVRLGVHVAAIGLMFCQWDIFALEPWWALLPALVFCTGVVNAFNFMDGINGINAGYGLAVLAPLAFLNGRLEFVDQDLVFVFGLSLLVFCWFNFRRKARCFAGDVGSVSVAFVLVYMTGLLVLRTGDLWWLMIMAVYGVDTGLTILHRMMLREPLGQAHRKHLYQLMANELHLPHTVVSSIYIGVQLLVSAGLLFLPVNKWVYSAGVLVALCVVYVWFIKRYYHLHEAGQAARRAVSS